MAQVVNTNLHSLTAQRNLNATQSENLSAARSRIQDADFTVETANLTPARMPQQAGTPGFRSECHDFRNQ
jgi:flagellin-like hook-associated protein FlgL